MGSDLTVAPVVHGAWARNGRATWSYGKDRKQGAQPAAPNPPPSKTTRTASGSTGTAATAARPPGPSSSRTYARPLRDLTEPCECCVTTGRRRRLRPGRHREAGLSPQCVVRKVLRERRPSGWGLQKLRGGRGPAGGVLHALDCEEAPQGAPLLDVEHALSRRTRGRGCAICAAARRSSRPCCEASTTSATATPDRRGPRRGGGADAQPGERGPDPRLRPRRPSCPSLLLQLQQGHGRKRPQRGCQGSDHARTVGVTCTDAAASARLAQEKSQEMPQE
ncbi:DUF6233 domain-containing protein [Streptomyces sp. NPDC001275]